MKKIVYWFISGLVAIVLYLVMALHDVRREWLWLLLAYVMLAYVKLTYSARAARRER